MCLFSSKRSLKTLACTIGLTTITTLITAAFAAEPATTQVTTIGLGSGLVKTELTSNTPKNASVRPLGATRQVVEAPLESPAVSPTPSHYDLEFKTNKYETRTGTINNKSFTYRAFENIPYVENPIDVNYQYMNIYIPEEYFHNQKVGDYNKNTAPIFFPNSVGSYMPSVADVPSESREGGPSASLYALSRGYVVATPATRGRANQNTNGSYYGKAPSAIVDLQAAVAYLHENDRHMAGDATHIISDGTSAGGALSLLLGAAGNNQDFAPYLKALGAADSNTNIFAAVAFAPITDLDVADKAYEWNFNSVKTYTPMNMGRGILPQTALDNSNSNSNEPAVVATTEALLTAQNPSATAPSKTQETLTLSDGDMSYSFMLKTQYPDYINELNLKDEKGNVLTMNSDGTGPFMNYIKTFIIDAANRASAAGTDISDATYLVRSADGTIIDVNWAAYNNHVGRMKTPGAFDARNNDTGENNLFGTATRDYSHFTVNGAYFDTAAKAGTSTTIANYHLVKMMNPMSYLGANYTDNAKYYYIRYGTADNNTSISIPIVVGTKAQNLGYTVSMTTPWELDHRGDYNLPELFNWIDTSVKDSRENKTIKKIKTTFSKIFR